MNDPIRNIPPTVQEEDEEIYANEDVQDDDVYVNTEFSNPSNHSIAETSRNTTTTPVPSSSKPPRTKPKPKTPQKPTSATKAKTQPDTQEHRESMFPPENPEDIYTNEPESADDDEDYVNSDGYQLGKR